ncbi:hypothetical protein GCM10008164_44010 [Achromobacter xylosoxidans]|nr:hypothetical protein GCM10008164_44010 [Achromobacter xylosoxidans]
MRSCPITVTDCGISRSVNGSLLTLAAVSAMPSPLTVTAGNDAVSCASTGPAATNSHSGQWNAHAALLRDAPAPVFTCFLTACPLRTLLRIILK